MKDIIEVEITGATYHVDLTAKNSILSAEPRTVLAVTRDLKTTLEHLTDEGESSPTDPRLPRKGFRSKPSSYDLLCNYLIKSSMPPVNTYYHLTALSANFVSIGSGRK
jgi:hypothetical protein